MCIRDRSNVGVVIDLAVHDIDLIRWFTDSEIVEIQPQLSSAIAEREDIALLQFRTASGVLAHINTNWLTPFKARTIHVATRDKYLIGDLLTLQVTECFGFQPDGSYSMRHLSVGYAEPLRSEPVSYTHLDVYKRQVLMWASTPEAVRNCNSAMSSRSATALDNCGWISTISESVNQRIRSMSVSYTHLDVYKRQA